MESPLRHLWIIIAAFLGASCAGPAPHLPVDHGSVTLPDAELRGVTPLTGTWEVYVDEALSPGELKDRRPRSYAVVPPENGRYYHDDGSRFVSGTITYRLVINNVPTTPLMAVRVPLAYGGLEAWVNGMQFLSIGEHDPESGVSAQQLSPLVPGGRDGVRQTQIEAGVIVPLVPDADGRVELVLHIDSRYYPYAGMTLLPARIGTLQHVVANKANRVLWDGLIVGALLLVAGYHLMIRLGPNHGVPSVALATFTALVALRVLLIEGEMVLSSVPWMNTALFTRLHGFAIYPLAALYLRILNHLFPAESRRRTMRTLQALSWGWLAVSMVAPLTWWMDTLYGWLSVLIASIGVAVVVVTRAIRGERTGARLVAAAMTVLMLGLILDVVRVSGLVQVSRSMMPLAWLGFALLSSIAVSVRVFDFRISLANLREQAQRDGLTGLYNRRTLDHRLQEEWMRHVRAAAPLAAIMVDIDHFKQFNDNLGHQAGDEVLIAVAAVLKAHAQRAPDFAARYGGEEFVLLLPNTEARGAYHLAERIRIAVVERRIPHPTSPARFVTVSLGVSALVPEQDGHAARHPEGLLAAADRALYDAKRAGRNAARSAAVEGAGGSPMPGHERREDEDAQD